MKGEINRRIFLKNSIKIPFITVATLSLKDIKSYSQVKFKRMGDPRIKISCNAYSYNSYLSNGKMTLDDLLELCAKLGFDAVDLTGYYFPNYPDVPPDEYIYHIKRKSFLLGLDIGGTGVRNDFTNPNEDKRRGDIEHIKKRLDMLDQRLDNVDSMVTAVAERVLSRLVTLIITCPHCGKEIEIAVVGSQKPRR
jgi:hypothetical protein